MSLSIGTATRVFVLTLYSDVSTGKSYIFVDHTQYSLVKNVDVVVVVLPQPPLLTQISSSNCLEICQRRLVVVLPPICLLGIAIF